MKFDALVDRYCEAWNEADPIVRAALLAEVMAVDSTYVDPRCELKGRDELHAHIGRMQESRPRMTVVRTSAVDVHHAVARFAWCLRDVDGQPQLEGVDFVEFHGHTLKSIVGFFGPVAER